METKEALKHTPLYPVHLQLGARMVPFAGFEMPLQYTGIIEEHLAVRNRAGLFDVSHMGEFLIEGPEAFNLVQYLVTNDAAKLYDGRAMYTVMCNAEGGIIDDLLVYRLKADRYMMVVNAANIQKDFNWVTEHNRFNAEVQNISDKTALMALQGPLSFEIAQTITELPLSELKYYHFLVPEPGTFLGTQRAIISYTGYTGERGLEIYCEPERAVDIWNALMDAGKPHGLQPAGLGARDTLRIEAGYCLYGNDITEETNPLEAGLGWIVKLAKGDFIGREALLRIKEEGPRRRLVGFVMEERGIPRPGYSIQSEDGTPIGQVTSGTQSPLLKKGIGLGYVPNDPTYTTPDARIWIDIRGKAYPARVKKPPFHKSTG